MKKTFVQKKQRDKNLYHMSAIACLQGILSSGSFDPKTGDPKFIDKEVAAKKAIEYADELYRQIEDNE